MNPALVRGFGPIARALALFSGQGRTETFRWMDENGVAHYPDQVPPAAAKPGF
jgi:hypothetical protein